MVYLRKNGIVCKHCGKLLQKHDADEFDGFIDGKPIITRDILDNNNLIDKITIESTFIEKDVPEALKILEIMDSFLKITKINDLNNESKILLTKSILNEIKLNLDGNYFKKIKNNIEKIKNYTLANRILTTISYLFFKCKQLKIK